MPTLLSSHIPALVVAELLPDGADQVPELDLDLDSQDCQLHEPESDLEIALPGRW